MRSALRVTILLALSCAALGAAPQIRGIIGKVAGGPPPEQHRLALAAANAADSPHPAEGQSGVLPGSAAVSSGTADAARQWAERMFTAGLSKDFGTVPLGTQLLHRFEMTNVYAEPVEITGLRLSCGCVSATPGQRYLQPGESTTVDVAFDTRTFTGPNTQTVRVGVGPNPRTSCTLRVSAVSQTDVVCKPDRMLSFGEVARGQAAVRSMDVECQGGLDWKIEEVIVAKDLPLAATCSELVRRPGKVGYRLDVALKKDAPRGKIRDYIYLKTNQRDVPPVPVLVIATVQAAP